MKHLKLLALLALAVFQSCSAYRQSTALTVTCPDAVRILPDFPSFDDKEAFFNDSLLYRRGKALRDTERGRQAVLDSDIQLDFFLKRFGEVMGVELNREATPSIVSYLEAVYAYTGEGIRNAKDGFKRQRPFSHFGEPSAIPDEEGTFGRSSSYPSGHSLLAWMVALSLTSIDEAHEYDIIRLGYELGQSRVISGFHYQSDVDAARLAAGVAYARIVSDPQFIKLMNLARKELESQPPQI